MSEAKAHHTSAPAHDGEALRSECSQTRFCQGLRIPMRCASLMILAFLVALLFSVNVHAPVMQRESEGAP